LTERQLGGAAQPAPLTARSELALADGHCRRLLRGHYENFWVSSPAIPATLRPHFARLYAYCRTVDDLGDEADPAGLDPATRLGLWREDLDRCVRGRRPQHPVLLALADTIRTFELPAEPFYDLLEANLQDQRVHRYDSWPSLRGYCRLSAAPVGRVVLRLFGVRDPGLDVLSDDVCIGLQLANFAQDVTVDAGKGRTYLLQAELAELGLAGAVRAMCERAGALLESGRALEAALPFRPRLQVALYRLGGEAILRAIRRARYRTDRLRPTVSNLDKLLLAPLALAQVTRARAPEVTVDGA
jgi:squalene synthase HpnC